ncbi:MAG: acylphosphatase [bacterium]|nr:acylphosphatase [bacterium]
MDKNLGQTHIFVFGRVQGVFFRDAAKRQAQKLGLFGWVRNLNDGSVEILAEGKKEALEKMINWVKQGPILAKVEKIKTEQGNFSGQFKKFEIRFN